MRLSWRLAPCAPALVAAPLTAVRPRGLAPAAAFSPASSTRPLASTSALLHSRARHTSAGTRRPLEPGRPMVARVRGVSLRARC